MSNEIKVIDEKIISSVILNGDISKLNDVQRVQLVTNLCERLGLDVMTQPFKILKLNGREVLYADKGCAQQLCKVYNISTEITKRETINDIYIVATRASMSGRFTDEDGAVPITNLKGENLSNAMMKAATKSKRRAVLALCGLGMLDESEVSSIPDAVGKPIVDMPTKKIEKKDEVTDAQLANEISSQKDANKITAAKVAALNRFNKSLGAEEFQAVLTKYGVKSVEEIQTSELMDLIGSTMFKMVQAKKEAKSDKKD